VGEPYLSKRVRPNKGDRRKNAARLAPIPRGTPARNARCELTTPVRPARAAARIIARTRPLMRASALACYSVFERSGYRFA
jgi:hypothetical protein